jgi:hypothetical protein
VREMLTASRVVCFGSRHECGGTEVSRQHCPVIWFSSSKPRRQLPEVAVSARGRLNSWPGVTARARSVS